MSMVGRTYLWHGQQVKVVIQWRTGDGASGPRNVCIERADGTRDIVPSRSLRRCDAPDSRH